jgi:hypothetical protein
MATYATNAKRCDMPEEVDEIPEPDELPTIGEDR